MDIISHLFIESMLILFILSTTEERLGESKWLDPKATWLMSNTHTKRFRPNLVSKVNILSTELQGLGGWLPRIVHDMFISCRPWGHSKDSNTGPYFRLLADMSGHGVFAILLLNFYENLTQVLMIHSIVFFFKLLYIYLNAFIIHNANLHSGLV